MENNFFVGIVNHSKKVRRDAFCEKMILYKENSSCYVDLLNDITYSTDSSLKDYVEVDTLVPTDVSEYKTDYFYLLSRHNNVHKDNVKKKKKVSLSIFK